MIISSESEEESDEEGETKSNDNSEKGNKKREKIPCVYCGQLFGGIGWMKRHLNYCSSNPNVTKKQKKIIFVFLNYVF